VKRAPGNPGVIDEVPDGRIYKDAPGLAGRPEARNLRDRRLLA